MREAGGSEAQLVRMMPRESRALVTTLLKEPLLPIPQLRKELRDHVVTIQQAAAKNEFLDVSLALRLSEVATALIEEGQRRGDEDTRRLVQAAVRYFILDDDGEHDLESVCGLDDDAEVCNVVARALGRDELVVEA